MSDSWDPTVVFSVPTISQAKYWSGLPFPSSGDLSSPGIEPVSPPLAGGFFTTGPPRKTPCDYGNYQKLDGKNEFLSRACIPDYLRKIPKDSKEYEKVTLCFLSFCLGHLLECS